MHEAHPCFAQPPPNLEVEFGITVAVRLAIGYGEREVTENRVGGLHGNRITWRDDTRALPGCRQPPGIILDSKAHSIDDGRETIVKNACKRLHTIFHPNKTRRRRRAIPRRVRHIKTMKRGNDNTKLLNKTETTKPPPENPPKSIVVTSKIPHFRQPESHDRVVDEQ